MMRKHKD